MVLLSLIKISAAQSIPSTEKNSAPRRYTSGRQCAWRRSSRPFHGRHKHQRPRRATWWGPVWWKDALPTRVEATTRHFNFLAKPDTLMAAMNFPDWDDTKPPTGVSILARRDVRLAQRDGRTKGFGVRGRDPAISFCERIDPPQMAQPSRRTYSYEILSYNRKVREG